MWYGSYDFECMSSDLRSEYNLKRSEVETLKFKYLVAQETIEQLRKELKTKEETYNVNQSNSGNGL